MSDISFENVLMKMSNSLIHFEILFILKIMIIFTSVSI